MLEDDYEDDDGNDEDWSENDGFDDEDFGGFAKQMMAMRAMTRWRMKSMTRPCLVILRPDRSCLL